MFHVPAHKNTDNPPAQFTPRVHLAEELPDDVPDFVDFDVI